MDRPSTSEDNVIVCPKCSSNNLVHVIYGYRNSLEEYEKEEIEQGHAVFGGCGINPESPEYVCRDCNALVGRGGPMWQI